MTPDGRAGLRRADVDTATACQDDGGTGRVRAAVVAARRCLTEPGIAVEETFGRLPVPPVA